MSGGWFPQFEKQLLASLSCPPEYLEKFYLLPTSGSQFYHWNQESESWQNIYTEKLTAEEKKKILQSIERSLIEADFEKPAQIYGPQIQDRMSQISFSAIGQDAPLAIKKEFDPDKKKRLALRVILEKYLPEFQIGIGGANTIDITRPGVDKAYGMKKLSEITGFVFAEMVFVGDDLEEGGNDYPVKAAGIDTIAVIGPEEAKTVIEKLLA